MPTRSILMLVEWYYPIGGIETFVSRLLEHFPENIHVTLAVLSFGDRVNVHITNENVKIHYLECGNLTKQLLELAKTQQFDLIHSNHVSAIGLAGIKAARHLKIPLLLTNHRVPVYRTLTPIDWFAIPVTTLYYRLVNNRATELTTPSETVATLLKKIGIRRPITVISCGINTEVFTPPTTKLENTPPVILFMGRFGRDKHLDILLRAFAEARKTVEATLVMVGFAAVLHDEWKRIQQLVLDLHMSEHVQFPGYLEPSSPEHINAYQTADVFAMTSLYETQSIATLEAMACGLPILASNSGALPELVTESVNGYLFEPLNWKNASEKLITLIQNAELRKTMGEKSREVALRHKEAFTVEKFCQLYERLLATR